MASSADLAARKSYQRVMLKLGGEMLGGGQLGIDPNVVETVARQIADIVQNDGVQMCVVIGGGNFFRGAELSQRGMDRDRADYIGMLGTVQNSIALQDFLEKLGVDTRVQTAIAMGQIAEPYIPRKAKRHLEKGRVVIFAAGVGMPYFSTDTAATQRGLEMGCEAILMAKAVDGVYDCDPRRNPNATKFDVITHQEVLELGLEVADATAFALCKDNDLPIVVFKLLEEGNIARVIKGEKIGTLVCSAS